MNAEIVAIGTELLLGQNTDTNSGWIARELALMGIDVFGFQAVGDNEKRLEAALKLACERGPIVIATGGLGPTVDDVTRKVAARLAGKQLVFHDHLAKAIEERFARFRPGKPFPKANLNQAFLPQGATVIPNANGTAPGFIVKVGKAHLACLPGVPFEMKAMFEETLKPFLKGLGPTGSIIKSRVFRTTGIDESALNEKIRDLFEGSTNPTIGVLAHWEGVDIRLTAKEENEAKADLLIEALGKNLTTRLPNFIYGWDKDDLETIVGRMLTTRNMTLATAESCSGGLISHRITQVPGSSTYFLRGYVVYSNRAKEQALGVSASLIEKKGAVSREVAEALALGARKAAGSDLALSTTGIAGPGGGSAEKPVGLVHIALADDQGAQSFEFRFTGDRSIVKKRTSQAALEILRRYCLGLPYRD
ncbi:MAG TPA: competence/damage-inducible protein A [bacterium]|nr:competence/damage-inducible protein A [bacterium]